MSSMQYRILADVVFAVHFCVVMIMVFGWIYSPLFLVHVALNISGVALQLILGYCFLSRWEFLLRKKADPALDYDHGYVSYYIYKVFGTRVRDSLLHILVPSFIIILLLIHGIFFIMSQNV